MMASEKIPAFNDLSFQAQWAAQFLRENLASIQRDAKVLVRLQPIPEGVC